MPMVLPIERPLIFNNMGNTLNQTCFNIDMQTLYERHSSSNQLKNMLILDICQFVNPLKIQSQYFIMSIILIQHLRQPLDKEEA